MISTSCANGRAEYEYTGINGLASAHPGPKESERHPGHGEETSEAAPTPRQRSGTGKALATGKLTRYDV